MNNSTPIRIGLVGAGGIAQTYAQAAAVCSAVKFVGVADVREASAQDMASKLGCPAFADHESLYQATQCEAVVICSPPSTHADLCEWFLQRNVHVLCEKPLAPNLKDCQRIVDAANASEALLTMASKFRYVEDVARAKQFLNEGLIGEVVLFENAFTSRVDMVNRWNSNPEISGGGVLIDNGTHSVDIMRFLLGPLAELQVIEGLRVQPISVEDTVKIYLKSEAGVMGSVDLSWSINKELSDYIRIYGSEGTISIGWKESKYRRAADKDWTVFGRGYDKVQAFSSQLTNFARAAHGLESLEITLDDAVASVEVVDAAYRALRAAKWLPITRQFVPAA
jgi:predicted dehydrogenase